VTVVGQRDGHAAYVDALLTELELERELLAPRLETIFFGGGTPTYLDATELGRLLRALPPAEELTVEANPETVTPELTRLLVNAGVTRVSLGAQSFQPHLLRVLERRATPDAVRRAIADLRDAGVGDISLDLLYGIPGQSPADLARDLDEAIRLEPEHLSCYELEAKPGTRFTHVHGEELERSAEAMEGYLEIVVDTLRRAGYRWYETSSFCRQDRMARHNLAYWKGRDYLGIGIGAVSTIGEQRWRNRPGLPAYLEALLAAMRPPRELEQLTGAILERERLMLGLRLDEPVALASVAEAIEPDGLDAMVELGLVLRQGDCIELSEQGRRLGGGVTAALLAGSP
jgi:oxygen-independent coproporphyrinogen-3 oxidase